MIEIKLRTGVWYNDRSTVLRFPDEWDVVTYWPSTPSSVSDGQIIQVLNSPVGQSSLAETARGKRAPLVIVDDLSRPTPVYRIVPFILRQLNDAGIDSENVRVLVATGTHGHQDQLALTNKLGKETVASCKVLIHNDRTRTRYVGKTSFGTPVFVNDELLSADLILGIGGVYPQHTTGFGGGSKLALGVLGRKSIAHLHFGHRGVDGRYDTDNTFRQDVTEIARLIGLNTIYTLFINAQQEVVKLLAGDHFEYYNEAAGFAKKAYTAPPPADAEVVIVNAYPSDISYTFMRKAMKPVRCAPRQATKIMVASNPEGIGKHGIFSHSGHARLNRYRELYYRASIMEPRVIISKILKNLFRRRQNVRPLAGQAAPLTAELSDSLDDLWLYAPDGASTVLPRWETMNVINNWDQMLAVIKSRHPQAGSLKVRIYPCGSLQCIDSPTDGRVSALVGAQ